MKKINNYKSVIISGARGYFGGVACEYFQQAGWQVLQATRHENDLYFDLEKPEIVSQIILDKPADLFIHAAAAHEVKCREQPYNSVFLNVIGTKAALDFCVRNKIEKFVYLSTFHVFGHPQGVLNEKTYPLPVNDYGLSHLQAEQYVDMYTREGKLHGLIIRPSNFFGIPSDLSTFNRWTLTPLDFCRQAIKNREIRLLTPGLQKRNFIDVKDICRVIEKAVSNIEKFSIIHAAGPDTISIKQLAELVQDATARLGYKINVCAPEGQGAGEIDFSYESLYLNDIYLPKQNITNFIFKMCEVLLNAYKNNEISAKN